MFLRCSAPLLIAVAWSSVAGGQEGPADALTTDALTTRLRNIVQAQAAAWNQGDIDGFMQAYWKSDKLSFSSGGKVTRGWRATRDGYRQRYPDRRAMGVLRFSDLEVAPLGDSAALMLGKWRLEREEPIGGVFSLVFRKLDGAWVIVHDHTSVTPAD